MNHMADILVLGAGVAGHTAALHAKRLLGRHHRVTVVTPNSNWNWIPSNIWVGVGKMAPSKVVFPLAPVYRRKKIDYVQAKAVSIHPFGAPGHDRAFVEVESTATTDRGTRRRVPYDYLVNATGPQLRFDLTPGLGPDGHSVSVCTYDHATEASRKLDEAVARMRDGVRQTLVVGMGHGTCTCEGAAFEYVFNVDHVLREAGVRDMAEVIYLSNEHELGDFGVGGMTFVGKEGSLTSEQWMSSLFHERGIRVILGAHVTEVQAGTVCYELISGEKGEQGFDFAMLLPPFRGVAMATVDRGGNDISDTMFAPSGFFKVDADYSSKPFEEWSAEDWPKTYESPVYPNHFAAGIAFAPPHAISRPYTTPSGVLVAPAPPRTGMPSGVQGRAVAETIAQRVKSGNPSAPAVTASMAHMGAACIASVGAGPLTGAAATITMSPIIPDRTRFPETGRDTNATFGELGLAGHWMKRVLHTLFIYKAKALPGWSLIPE
jgi:sulfide:quinone oxidoreductase